MNSQILINVAEKSSKNPTGKRDQITKAVVGGVLVAGLSAYVAVKLRDKQWKAEQTKKINELAEEWKKTTQKLLEEMEKGYSDKLDEVKAMVQDLIDILRKEGFDLN